MRIKKLQNESGMIMKGKRRKKLVSGKRNLVWGVNLRQMQRLNLFCGLKFNFNIQTHLESIFAHCFLLSHFFNIKYSNYTFINLQNSNTSSYLSSLLSKHHTQQNKRNYSFSSLISKATNMSSFKSKYEG